MTGPVQSGDGPYVGPRPFEAGQQLYGRDPQLWTLRDLLIAERIVMLYSPSGAGKTSLIQAALIPALEEEGFLVRPIVRAGLDPTTIVQQHPPGANRYTLSSIFSLEHGTTPEDSWLRPDLAALTLPAYLSHSSATSTPSDLEVLIFDQFEELLTADPTDHLAKQQFFEQLGTVLRSRKRWALFSLREDYIAGLDPYLRCIPNELKTRFRLDLLREHEARLAIQLPARSARRLPQRSDAVPPR